MLIEFNEKKHLYVVNGDIANISVTELLAKHGIAPDYSSADEEILKKGAEEGKIVHEDLENVLNTAKYTPKTKQGKRFKSWIKSNIECGVGEQLLGIDYNGLKIGGTADVMGILKNGMMFVGDHKNTSVFHREYVTWQVNLYDYFARKLDSINNQKFIWKGALKFYCFHYNKKSGNMKVHELEKIPDSEIEKLLECELKGEKYQRPLLVVDNELQKRFMSAENKLANIELSYRKAQEKAQEVREQIKKLFEEQNIKSWETPDGKLKVTYIEQNDRISVDNKKLKEQFPQVYSQCQKLTSVKPSIRITVRGDEDDG